MGWGPEICIRSFQVMWMMLAQGPHFQREVQRKCMAAPSSPSWTTAGFPHCVPTLSMPSPQYNLYTVFRVMFSKESQTISFKGLKLFSGFFGTNSQVLIWIYKTFMKHPVGIFPTSSCTTLWISILPLPCSSSDRQSTCPPEDLCTCFSLESPPMPWFSHLIQVSAQNSPPHDAFSDHGI